MSKQIFLCPNCNISSTYSIESKVFLDNMHTSPNQEFLTIRCDTCDKITFKIIAINHISRGQYVPPSISEKEIFQYPYGFINIEPAFPQNITGYYTEAFNSYKTGQLRAAASMCRATISAICDDKKATGEDLKERINSLPLSNRLATVAKNIKWVGDKTLHNELDWAKEDWKPEIIKEVLDFIERIIDDLYTQERKAKELNNSISKLSQKK